MKKIFIICAVTAIMTSPLLNSFAENVAVTQPATQTAGQDLLVTDAWARPTYSTPNSAVYMQITNPNPYQIVISGVVSSVANKTEMHQSVQDTSGVMRMVPISQITVPAHTTISLAPKGLHIMLMKLKQNLEIGMNVQISLTTLDPQGNHNSIVLQVPVKTAAN